MLTLQCLELADRWDKARNDSDFKQFSPSDVGDFLSTQKCVFLDRLGAGEAFKPEVVRALDDVYGFNKQDNAEIGLRFYKIALKSGPEYARSAAGKCGRVTNGWERVLCPPGVAVPTARPGGDAVPTWRLSHRRAEALSCVRRPCHTYTHRRHTLR